MLDSLQRILKQPKALWAVKMADRISNLGEPPHYWNNEKRRNYQNEAKIILEHLAEGNELLAVRLQEKIDDYAKYI